MKVNILETDPCKIETAIEMDNNDPLCHFKSRFHFPKYNAKKEYIYLCGNSLGLQPDSTEKYIKEELITTNIFTIYNYKKNSSPRDQ